MLHQKHAKILNMAAVFNGCQWTLSHQTRLSLNTVIRIIQYSLSITNVKNVLNLCQLNVVKQFREMGPFLNSSYLIQTNVCQTWSFYDSKCLSRGVSVRISVINWVLKVPNEYANKQSRDHLWNMHPFQKVHPWFRQYYSRFIFSSVWDQLQDNVHQTMYKINDQIWGISGHLEYTCKLKYR